MVSVDRVDPNQLIVKVAEDLKKTDFVKAPEWAKFVKTGVFKQRAPVQGDWWFIRTAAILRSVYKLGPIGVSKLRTKYGGKQNRGVRPEKFKVAGGSIIRHALQQLEKEGLIAQVKNDNKKGRIITPKGQSLLDKASASIAFGEDGSKKASKPAKEAKAPKEEAKAEKVETKKEAKAEEVKKEGEN